MNYYKIEPEIAGGWGNKTVVERIPGKPEVIRKLHYEVDTWMGDELLETSPCYIVSERLARALEQQRFTGFKLDEVEVTPSEQCIEVDGDPHLPRFLWLKVEGDPGRDDFGIDPHLYLVVSERAYKVLTKFGISHADVTPFKD